jgi:hypothetical protein
VIILVAVQACRIKPQVGVFFRFDFLILNKLRFMTGLAFLPGMGAFELISRQIVIEGGFTEPHYLEVSAMVIVMTYYTFFRLHI